MLLPNYLNEIITSAMNVSAKQYIQNKLMDEAKRLLVYTGLPMSVVASELGYSTTTYFVRSFRLSVKETPLNYREKHKP